jgi:hypothetical protein
VLFAIGMAVEAALLAGAGRLAMAGMATAAGAVLLSLM